MGFRMDARQRRWTDCRVNTALDLRGLLLGLPRSWQPGSRGIDSLQFRCHVDRKPLAGARAQAGAAVALEPTETEIECSVTPLRSFYIKSTRIEAPGIEALRIEAPCI